MSVSIQDVRRLRRMVSELDDTTYNDDDIRAYLSNWALVDSEGRDPDNDDWTEAYDLHAAAAEIWEEKAAKVSHQHDFSADGSSFSANQMYNNCMEMARYHAARSKMKTKRVHKKPDERASGSDLFDGIYANIDPLDEDDIDIWNNL